MIHISHIVTFTKSVLLPRVLEPVSLLTSLVISSSTISPSHWLICRELNHNISETARKKDCVSMSFTKSPLLIKGPEPNSPTCVIRCLLKSVISIHWACGLLILKRRMYHISPFVYQYIYPFKLGTIEEGIRLKSQNARALACYHHKGCDILTILPLKGSGNCTLVVPFSEDHHWRKCDLFSLILLR